MKNEKNRVVLKKFSETKISLSKQNINNFLAAFKLIGKIESYLENINLKFKSSIFLIPLLEKEGIDSAILEGTQTNHDEMFYDILGIDNVYAWETRNLINLYKDTFVKLENGTFKFSEERLRIMHEKLYKSNLSPKWKNTFNPHEVIKAVKPGHIIEDDFKPNWIGARGSKIEDASLIPIKPSKKIEYLKDLCDELEKEPSYENIIKLYPIFEGIHPFTDGNGRIGRVILTSYFKKSGYTKNNWLFFSSVFHSKKQEYIHEMKHVQTTSNWNRWTTFFINTLLTVITKKSKQIRNIVDLYINTIHSKKLNNSDEMVLRSFFKFPKLNKKSVIKWLVYKDISQAKAYRSFDKVQKLIQAKEDNGFYIFEKLIKIVRD